MNLFLTSTTFPQKAFDKVVSIVGNQKPKLAIVDAATKPYIENTDIDPDWLLNQFGELEKVGFEVTRFTVKDNDWLEQLQYEEDQFDALYLSGGNTFVLNWFLHTTNLVDVVNNFLNDDSKVVIGSSAGTVVCLDTIEPYKTIDDATKTEKIFYEGLGIFPIPIIVHWKNEAYQKELVGVAEDYQKLTKDEVLYLEDGESIYFDGKNWEYLND